MSEQTRALYEAARASHETDRYRGYRTIRLAE